MTRAIDLLQDPLRGIEVESDVFDHRPENRRQTKTPSDPDLGPAQKEGKWQMTRKGLMLVWRAVRRGLQERVTIEREDPLFMKAILGWAFLLARRLVQKRR